MGRGTPEQFHERAQMEINAWKECTGKRRERGCLKIYHPQVLGTGVRWLRWLPVFCNLSTSLMFCNLSTCNSR
jgi:hypothetical protein